MLRRWAGDRLCCSPVLRRGPGLPVRRHAIQGSIEFPHTLPPVRRPDRQPLHQGPLLRFSQFRPQPAGRDQGIVLLVAALDGTDRDAAGEAVVQGGAQAVQIAPRPLAMSGVLLVGGKALLEHGGHGGVSPDVPGAAKIHELDRSVFQEHQVVRADVPVDDPLFVHGGHGSDHRLHHKEQVLCGTGALLLSDLLKGLALQKFHDNVGGVVLREVVQHPNDLRDLLQGRHGSGLPQKLLPALGVLRLPRRGVAGHVQRDSGFPLEKYGGEILLHGYPALQLDIQAQIGDPKPSGAQRPPQEIPLLEQCSRRELTFLRMVFLRVPAAYGTGLSREDGIHAVWTVALHFLSPLYDASRRSPRRTCFLPP